VNEICILLPPNFSLKLFADDVKLYFTVISNSDAVDLQRCLHVISAWSDVHQLKLSPSKCTVMHLSHRRANHVFTFPYAINNQVLPVIDHATDLGVMYDNHLSFVLHINKTVNKASQRANLTLRCLTTRDPLVSIKAFNTFVRPLLDMPRLFGARLLKCA